MGEIEEGRDRTGRNCGSGVEVVEAVGSFLAVEIYILEFDGPDWGLGGHGGDVENGVLCVLGAERRAESEEEGDYIEGVIGWGLWCGLWVYEWDGLRWTKATERGTEEEKIAGTEEEDELRYLHLYPTD